MDNPQNTLIEDKAFFDSVCEEYYDAKKHKDAKIKTLGIKYEGKVAYVLFAEYNGKIMTTRYGKHLVDLALGRKSMVPILKMTGGVIPKSTQLFDSDTYLKIANAAANHGYHYPLYNSDGSILNVGVIIVLMMAFKDYSYFYDFYMNDPDDNVEIVENDTVEDGRSRAVKWAGDIGMQRTSDAHQAHKIEAMAYMTCFFMTKTTTVVGQFELVLSKRLDAFAAATGYLDIIGKSTEIAEVMPETVLNRLSKSMHFFPKLKMNIFNFLLFSKGPEFDHMSEIFKESQLTIFNIVYQFLISEIVTKLHIHPKVLAERIIWMEIFKKIYNKYNNNWPYYKLYEPRSLETAVSKYPILASAALSFAAVNAASTNIQIGRLAGRVRAIETFKKLARLHAPPELVIGRSYKSSKEMLASLDDHVLVPLRFSEKLLEDDVAWMEVEAELGPILS